MHLYSSPPPRTDLKPEVPQAERCGRRVGRHGCLGERRLHSRWVVGGGFNLKLHSAMVSEFLSFPEIRLIVII